MINESSIDGHASVDNSSSTDFGVQQLVHDKQHRQLCAIHALNNLLQLAENECKPRIGIHFSEAKERPRLMVQDKCFNLDETKLNALKVRGTKVEFDMIADSLTYQERILLEGGDSLDVEAETNVKKNLSLWNKVKSNHRTLLTGNYSFEVRNGTNIELLSTFLKMSPSFTSFILVMFKFINF